jgi:hypothetical protein
MLRTLLVLGWVCSLVLLAGGLATAAGTASSSSSGATSAKKPSDFKSVGDDDDSADAAKDAAASVKDEKPVLSDNEEIQTGTVSVIRKNGLNEVFFKDLKESYFIPSGSKNYGIYKAFMDAQKKTSKVTFRANKKSRQVISMEDASADPKNKSPDAGALSGGSK